MLPLYARTHLHEPDQRVGLVHEPQAQVLRGRHSPGRPRPRPAARRGREAAPRAVVQRCVRGVRARLGAHVQEGVDEIDHFVAAHRRLVGGLDQLRRARHTNGKGNRDRSGRKESQRCPDSLFPFFAQRLSAQKGHVPCGCSFSVRHRAAAGRGTPHRRRRGWQCGARRRSGPRRSWSKPSARSADAKSGAKIKKWPRRRGQR